MAQRPGTGVDTGGTFTDFVWLENGRLRVHKQLSTPADPAQAVLQGIAALQIPAEAALTHGSTVATNALLERRGARTALITTAGFADVLAIGRQNRPDLYALVPQKPLPLAPRGLRFEVQERVTAQGEVLQALDCSELEPIWEQLQAQEVRSVAVCLLFSFLRPEHEQAIGEWLLAADRQRREQEDDPGEPLHISLSSQILPEYREFERTATTVVNAYVAPLMARYLARLEAGVAPRSLTIMQSNGGVISAGVAAQEAARTVLSGPAGGVVGAHYVARRAGFEDVITFDMGGTSTDVALCPGRVPTTSEGEIAGSPLRLPMIDIHTVGAGGGSLAYVDPGGALHVGPQSAGADPGPICYGLGQQDGRKEKAALPARTRLEGGLYVTTTDANLVLGRLDEHHFLGGAMPLHREAAARALAALAQVMGADSAEAAALDVVRVANATMERAMRRISVERGHDPRDFTLVAYGGAGPLHACELARSMQIPRVLVPATPGVLSALGMIVAAPTRDYSRTVMRRLAETDAARLRAAYAPLEARAREEMGGEGYGTEQVTLHYALDMRYEGQSHELEVAFEPQLPAQALAQRFHEAHQKRYGYARREAPVEVVNVRLVATTPGAALEMPRQTARRRRARDGLAGHKAVWFADGPQRAALYERERLQPGQYFEGPAIVFQYDTTTVVPPDWAARVDGSGNLLLEV